MKDLFSSIRRTPYQSLASFLILFFALFLSIFVFNLTSFFNGILSYVESRPQVIAYFEAETNEKSILALKENIEKSGKAADVIYVSQEQALEIYKKLNSDNPLLLEMVSANILPASLEVYATRPEYLEEISSFLDKEPIVDEVSYQQNIVDRLLTLTTLLRRGSFLMAAFLVFISIIVLMSTSAFKIALKKDEIDLMQLLGATKFYIRKPFLSEGVFFGFIAASAAFIMFYLSYFLMLPFMSSYLTGIPSLQFYSLGQYGFFVFPPSLLFIALSYVLSILFGMILGFIGNWLSTSKYIK